MNIQIVIALAITVLTLIGLIVLPSLYHTVLAVFGLGCASLALCFALLIEWGERSA
jgi:hypothetical protein